MTEKRVLFVPPPPEVLQELAKRAAEAVGRPDTASELANFLEIVTRMKADALNKRQVAEKRGKV